MAEHTITVLDHGFVRLDEAMASDLSVVNAARVSFARRKEEMDESDEGLIRFLMRERHGTPFEHNAFRFHIRCPMFVAREWFRHRVGLVQRVLDALREGDRRLLRPGARRRADAGRKARRLLVRAGLRRARRDHAHRAAGGLRARIRDLRATRRAGRCAGAGPLRDPGRRLHRVLLDGERAGADELRLAARGRRRPSSRSAATPRRSSDSSPSRCRSHTRRSSRTTAPRPRFGWSAGRSARPCGRRDAAPPPSRRTSSACTAR